MSATIVEASLKALGEKVDKGGMDLNNVLAELADSLGKYGFKGSLKLDLTVVLNDDVFGDHVTLERTTALKFRR